MTRRSRRKHKKRSTDEVSLNMAAMLDMAFQLLAFFILTFRASPIEAQIELRLPDSPQATTRSSVQMNSSPQEMEDLDSPLPIDLYSLPTGELEKIVIGSRVMKSAEPAEVIQLYRQEMLALFATPTFDSIVIRVGKELHYEPLMQVVDLCTKQKTSDGSPMTKISINPLK
ncbi:MAG: biopolymer transporter ExbD [Planctomycetota bacterium]|jgi:biopolymer transport protein ExbD|nr:biopolymer transporter ExbD [Planctomycetota bacterium]